MNRFRRPLRTMLPLALGALPGCTAAQVDTTAIEIPSAVPGTVFYDAQGRRFTVAEPMPEPPPLEVEVPGYWMKTNSRPHITDSCTAVVDIRVDRNGRVTWSKLDAKRTTCAATHTELVEDNVKDRTFQKKGEHGTVAWGTLLFRFR